MDVENVVSYLLGQKSMRSVILSMYPTDKVEDAAVADFPDGADGVPVKDLAIDIDAVQDLHGYDNPWPAAGGKNKCPLPAAGTYSGITVTHNADGSITLTGTNTPSASYIDIFPGTFDSTAYAGYIFSYGDYSGSSSTVCVRITDSERTSIKAHNSGETTIEDNGSGLYLSIRIAGNYAIPSGGITLYPMLRASTESSTFAPYSNICPISGWTEAKVWVEPTHDTTANPTVTIDLDGTRYGGTLDVTTGVLTVTHGQIASYAGETLPGEWISDRDVYASGTSPSTGAQVVYELAEAQTVQLTPTEVKTLQGQNNLWSDTGNISVEYRADVELYIEKKIGEGTP